MVLVDEKGTGIHAYVPKPDIPNFQPMLKEGRVYYFHYFETSLASRPYRPTAHKCKLRITSWTRVTEVGPVRDDFPLHAFNLRSLRDIADNIMDKTHLADIVGLINGVSDVTMFEVRGNSKAKRNLRVTDGRSTAIVVLWGELATQIDADDLIHRSQMEPLILLAMGCTYKMQDSLLNLTPSYGSRICVNYADPHISAFRNRIIGLDFSIERLAEKGRRLAALNIENTSVASLAELIPNEAMDRMFRCAMRIQSIASNQSWWFRACDRCSCGAVEDGDALRCSGNACTSRSASPRYKLAVRAQDGEAFVNMIFFGDVATDLIGKPPDDFFFDVTARSPGIDELLNEFLASNEVLPSDIARLVGRSYVVDVVVSRLSIRRPTIDFQVVKFCTEGGSEYMDFLAANRPPGVLQTSQVAIPEESDLSAPSSFASPAVILTTAKAGASSDAAVFGTPDEPQISSGTSDGSKIAVAGGSAPIDEVFPQTPQGRDGSRTTRLADTPPGECSDKQDRCLIVHAPILDKPPLVDAFSSFAFYAFVSVWPYAATTLRRLPS